MPLLLAAWALALGCTNVTSRLGWERRARRGEWTLRCAGPCARAVLAAGGATAVVATVPAGARCRLRAATAWQGDARERALAGACWVGFGQRLCAPRGFVEHFEFVVPVH